MTVRIFVEALAAGDVAITGDPHHYLGRVRRARPGDPLELVEQSSGRRAAATIVRMTDQETIARAEAATAPVPAVPDITVLVPLIKGDRMASCLEKLVEAGANRVVVWPAERSVARLDPARQTSRLNHYTGVVAAAARQSGAAMPLLTYAESLAAALVDLPSRGRLVLDPQADRGPAPDQPQVVIASGPEGGLAPAELAELAGAGFSPFGLGPRILRAETAPVIAVALIRAATGS